MNPEYIYIIGTRTNIFKLSEIHSQGEHFEIFCAIKKNTVLFYFKT